MRKYSQRVYSRLFPRLSQLLIIILYYYPPHDLLVQPESHIFISTEASAEKQQSQHYNPLCGSQVVTEKSSFFSPFPPSYIYSIRNTKGRRTFPTAVPVDAVAIQLRSNFPRVKREKSALERSSFHSVAITLCIMHIRTAYTYSV